MTPHIVEIQRRAFAAKASDVASELARHLLNLGEAQRAALIARVAYDSRTPVDVVFVTDEPDDPMQAAMTIDGDVPTSEQGGWAWALGSGCTFQVCPTTKPSEGVAR